jgi:hypothetical protein
VKWRKVEGTRQQQQEHRLLHHLFLANCYGRYETILAKYTYTGHDLFAIICRL